MLCPSCNFQNAPDATFCEQCGSKLELVCPACKTPASQTARFCKKCGASLGATGAPSPKKSGDELIRVAETPGSENLDGERKTVTALFADIKGSMELMEDLDPEEARAIVDPALKLMIEAVHRYDGYIVQSTGDGVFALFGAPVAHEDHPQRALYSALRLQEDLRRYSDRLRERGKLPLQARVGVNTGEAVVRSIKTGEAHTEYTPIGHSTGLASRMQTLAPVGSIAVTDAARMLCEGYFTFKSLGTTQIKGVSEPVAVHEVTGLGPLRTRLQVSAQRGLTKFVGRHAELEQMKHALELAGSGHGQVVAAMGEPGVGKSRLLHEFKVSALSGCAVLETFSVSHGKASAYLPVIDLLKNYFKIRPEDDERARREKVIGKVLALDRALEDALPYLLGLAGVGGEDELLAEDDAQLKRRRTQEAVKRIILRESLNEPLVVIVEDLHWIDAETQAVMNLLVDSIANARVVLLVNYRPEYRHDWGSRTYYTQLRLDPLGKESAEEMLTALLDSGSPLPDQGEGRGEGLDTLKGLIIERTEGNPFFMEEIVQGLFEQGALARDGAVHLTRPVAEIRLPPTVQGILAARIDRLAPPEKELLQTLAVVGRQFPLGLVRSISGKPDDELERMLNTLRQGEFIYEQPAMGDVQYTFKHALTQEVAYNSLLVERRKALHQQTAKAIESVYASRLEDYYSALARHYVGGGNTGNAVRFLSLAGAQELERFAFAEAIEHARAGLELLKSLPNNSETAGRELDLTFTLLAASRSLKGPVEESWKVAAHYLELSRKLGNLPHLARALELVGLHEGNLGSLLKARELAEEAITVAHRLNDPIGEIVTRSTLSTILAALGDFLGARNNCERVLALAASLPGHLLRVRLTRFNSLINLSGMLPYLGFPDQALLRCRELAALEVPSFVMPPKIPAAWAALRAGHTKWAREIFGAVLVNTEDKAQNVGIVVWVSLLRGWLMMLDQDSHQALALIREGTSIARANGLKIHLNMGTPLLLEAYTKAGQADEGLKVANEELREMERSLYRLHEPELLRLKGELLLIRDARAAQGEAESYFRHAIALAKSKSAKFWELRAALSLARLLGRQGKREEARATLAGVYNWFTEGFDTADLKDAKALLEELGA